MKQVFANMGWLLGGRGFNAVLSLVYLAIAARTLGTEGFGHFALIIALGQAITGFSSFQTWQFIVRWGADPDNPGVDLQRAAELSALGADDALRGRLLEAEGRADGEPVAPNDSPANRSQNRRVEIVFSDEQGQLSPAR